MAVSQATTTEQAAAIAGARLETDTSSAEDEIVVTAQRRGSAVANARDAVAGNEFVNAYRSYGGGNSDPTQTPLSWLSSWNRDVYLNQSFPPGQARDAINAVPKDGRWSQEDFDRFGDDLFLEGSNNPHAMVKAREMLDLAATDPAYSEGWQSVSGRVSRHLDTLNAKADAAALEVTRSVMSPLDVAMSANSIRKGKGTTGDYVTVAASALPVVGRAAVVTKTAVVARVTANAARGRAFEEAAIKGILGHIGLGKNTRIITEILPNGKKVDTIVDVSGRHVGLIEFKDVKYLTLSKQLAAQLQHAERNGLPFNLVVSPTTRKLSQPLLRSIQRVTEKFGGGVYRYNPATDILKPW